MPVKAANIYTILYPDGTEHQCKFAELLDIAISAGSSLSKYSIKKIVLNSALQKMIPIDAICRPALSRQECAFSRWNRPDCPGHVKFEGVEGFDHPVTVSEVRMAWILSLGRELPSKEAVRTRLMAGARTKAEILRGRKRTVTKPYQRRKIRQVSSVADNARRMADAAARRKATNAARVIARREKERALAEQAVRRIESLRARTGSVKKPSVVRTIELPPMKDWAGYDKHAYYRQPLSSKA